MDETVLHQLKASSSPAEKAAIIAEAIFGLLPKEVALVARRCVIFHWFDQRIIEALREDQPQTPGTSGEIYERLATLPFIETVPWGLTFQDLTREGLLQRYSLTQPELLRSAARLAAPIYQASGDKKIVAEALFCHIIAGESSTGVALLDTLLEYASMHEDWQFNQSILRIQEEAEALPFVHPLPHTERLWILQGYVHRVRRQWEEALLDYDAALVINPRSALAYLSKGTIYAEQQRFAEALTHYNRALSLDPTLVQAYVNRGIIFAKQMRNAEALEDFERALQLDPSSQQAEEGRSYALSNSPTPQFAVPQPLQPSQLVTPPQQGSSEIRAMLAISAAEASYGTTRTLVLPDGRHIMVRIPAGAYNGQRISVQGSGGSGGPPGTLTLSLVVLQASAPGLSGWSPVITDTTNSTTQTTNPSGPPYYSGGQSSYTSPPIAKSEDPITPPLSPRAPFRRGPSSGIILTATIALLVIFGGISFGFVSYNNAQQSNANATATAQANSNATATALAVATATSIAATATAVASTYPFSANLKSSDPMSDNSKGNGWQVNNFCKFQGNAYHAFDDQANTFNTCSAVNTNFSNFTYEVQAELLSGDGIGITFRGNADKSQFYRLDIFTDGRYTVYLYVGNTGTNSHPLTNGNITPAPNLTDTNLISVVARGSTMMIYFNKTEVTSFIDPTYTSGQIGVAVTNLSKAAEGVFTNANVWTLP